MGWIPEDTALSILGHAGVFRACCAQGPLESSLQLFVCWTQQPWWKNGGNFYWQMSSKYDTLQAPVTASRAKSECKKFEGGLQPINTNNSTRLFISFLTLCFFAAEHWLHQPVQQLCPRAAAVLPRCWALLVTGEGRLLPRVPGHQGLRGQLPGAQRALRLPHRGLWGLDQSYYCHPQVACSQVWCTVN